MILDKIQSSFRSFGLSPAEELTEFASKCDDYSESRISLDDLQLSMMIYLDKVAYRNQALSHSINRHREPQMGDVYTEALNMAFQAIIHHPLFNGEGWKVDSERNFYLEGNHYIKPDVGCFKGLEPVFIIECKTNLGYERYSWKDNYERKHSLLVKSNLHHLRYFLCVLTDSNWGGFPPNDSRTGKQWVTFCKKGSWVGGKNGSIKLQDGSVSGILSGIVETLIDSL